MERLVELVRIQDSVLLPGSRALYVIDVSSGETEGVMLSEELRSAGCEVISHCGGGKLKARLRRADQSGAALALIVGDRELEAGVVQVKHLRDNTPDCDVPRSEISRFCSAFAAP